MEYIKINSLWKREGWYFDQEKKKSPDYQKGRQSFIIGDYAEPEFGNIKKWRVDEKVDGTNIRITFSSTTHEGTVSPSCLQLSFGGRTDNAQLPCLLLEHLQNHFTKERMLTVFPDQLNVRLFGEGYGHTIQSAGKNYRKDPGFVLFDVKIGDWWLKREDVKQIANKLSIDIVPDLGIMTEEEIIEFVKSKPLSRCSMNPQMMEGIVARSEPLMLFRNGKPLIWKLKCREF